MTATIIDGKAIAQGVLDGLKNEIASLKTAHGVVPGLAVILVGANQDSVNYIAGKKKAAEWLGIQSIDVQFPCEVSKTELINKIKELNNDPSIHGILLQLPLPKPADMFADEAIDAINPLKDVDGLTDQNVARLHKNRQPRHEPCTPRGIIHLVKTAEEKLTGKNAVVLGRSPLVGKPVVRLLEQHNYTVTHAHSGTHDLPDVCRTADLLVVAIRGAEVVRGDWIKPGAVVIDVGIEEMKDANGITVQNGAGKPKKFGNVCFAEASGVAGAITPVPGGVGPMTVAYLMDNVVQGAHWLHNIAIPMGDNCH